MARNGTSIELTPAMIRAAQALAAGDSDTLAAKAAGVGRTTLYRWLKEPVFIATKNVYAKQASLAYWHTRSEQIKQLRSAAMEALKAAMDEAAPLDLRAKTAIAVFEKLGEPGKHIGPTDPAEVARQWSKLDKAEAEKEAGIYPGSWSETLHPRYETDETLNFMGRIADLTDAPDDGT